MKNALSGCFRLARTLIVPWLVCCLFSFHVQANPTGGTVKQGSGSATITGQGTALTTINQTSANAFINWSSFNIAAGETTTFVQPSSSSVTWNYINDPKNPSASVLNGNLNANGYVVLQNPNGFTVGGTASISAHGLVMTTAATPALDLSSGGAWSFNAPPPTANIINYGQINMVGGGSVYLIASDIENKGTISAPGGKIGLYAGQQVLVSMAPDGRGLSARVTLPEGSVDNEGQLIADAGSIAAQAKLVNQDGLVQANSVQNVNGVIELVASGNLALGASSVISAKGDATTTSPGGFVVLKSGNVFSDTSSSTISVSGNAGGQDGILEIFDPGVNASPIKSKVIGSYYAYLVNPFDIILSSDATDTSSSSPILNVNDLAAYRQIDLQALDNIELTTAWFLPNPSSSAALNLTAGNSIILDDGTTIGTGYGGSGFDWTINLVAGTGLPASNIKPAAGSYGIYLNGDSSIFTLSGDINLWAANEVIVTGNVTKDNGNNVIASGGITTFGGGNISVSAQYGDVNTGQNYIGYDFGLGAAPYYAVDGYLGGISTAAGGNVTIHAGRDVISYLPRQSDFLNPQYIEGDAGAGAFGPQPGNVTITAGRNVYGHYVVANGIGTITAGGNIGVPLNSADQSQAFALSLISGGWNVYAPNGSIYVQDIRNPNGVFGEYPGSSSTTYAGYHYFDYALSSSVLLEAGNSVEFTGVDAPQTPPSISGKAPIPFILPPSLQVITGSGDFILDTSLILFPSPDQNLNLAIGGNFIGKPNGNPINLEMSDSAATSWVNDSSFGTGDHAAATTELNNLSPVSILVSGNLQDVNLYTTKQTQMTVGGNIINSGFVGENLHASDVTSINVAGSIENSPLYAFAQLISTITSANPLQPNAWDSIFSLTVNPNAVAAIASLDVNNPIIKANGLAYYLKQNNYLLFPSPLGSTTVFGSNPGFVYDPASKQLGFKGSMKSGLTPAQIAALEGGTVTVLVADSQGNPIVDPTTGHLETTTYHFSASTVIASLYTQSLNDSLNPGLGFQIGGPGRFNISAGSINLGNSPGIVSYGFGSGYGPSFASLENECGTLNSGGAAINVNAAGDLDMLTSRICSIDGGNVSVFAGGDINLSQGNFVFPVVDCYGIFTSGHSDVNVVANGNVNVGSARIATFNGGNVFVQSLTGDVNAGNGANYALQVYCIYLDPVTGLPVTGRTIGDLANVASLKADPAPYGSGILAEYPTKKYQTPGGSGQPGNITVLTPHGNIVSGVGGISQFALDQTIAGGPTVTLEAGLAGVAANSDQGNILLGGAVIGGTVNVTATGKIQGSFISKQNLNITGLSFSGLGLAGQTANVSTSQAGDGPVIIVGIGGINANGLGGSATLLGQNVSTDGGAAQSTLGTSSGATASSQSAAQQANQEAAQQTVGNDTESDDQKNKKKPQIRKISRVTVLLSSATPAH